MLEKEYANDPALLNFYRKRLLTPLWSGEELTDAEAEYIAKELTCNRELRLKWRKAYGITRRVRRISGAMVKQWCENELESHTAI